MSRTTTDALYLVTIVTFILALRFLSSPKHARKGNWIGAAGMLLAIVVTLLQDGIGNYGLIAIGMVVGGAVGLIGARTVKMTAMPQMVALFNGVGGGAAALISLDEFHRFAGGLTTVEATSTALSALIGSVSFSGSMIAFAKLQELISGRPIVFRGQQIVNALIIGTAAVLGIWIAAGGTAAGTDLRPDRRRPRLRRHVRAADRRRRHARRDLAPERVHRDSQPPRRASSSTTTSSSSRVRSSALPAPC